MSNWGISPNASEKEKIKADYADILHGMNSTGAIPYDVYSDLFDAGMELFDRMYEQGKADAVPVVHGRWVDHMVRDWRCSECGDKIHKVRNVDGYCYDDKPNYCPGCGAKMDGERQDVDG